MTVPPVSIVLPVYNGAPHLAEAVQSLLAQTYGDFELVLCDDGSTDATGAICAELAARDSRIRVMHRPVKSGVAAAANWAVSEAHAPLVAIAHADDLSQPDRLARQFAVMRDHPDCVLTGAPMNAIDWNGQPAHPPNLWRLVRPSAFAPLAHSSIMFRRAAFDAVGGYRDTANYWEDLDLYWRMARKGRILVSVDLLTTYRYSRISIRMRDPATAVEGALETMYRSAAMIESGLSPDHLALEQGTKLHPRIFVARSWSRVWAGERPGLLGRLLRHGRLRCDRATLESVAFLAWASCAPKSLRFTLRLLTRLRNRIALHQLKGSHVVVWDPFAGSDRNVTER